MKKFKDEVFGIIGFIIVMIALIISFIAFLPIALLLTIARFILPECDRIAIKTVIKKLQSKLESVQ